MEYEYSNSWYQNYWPMVHTYMYEETKREKEKQG